MSKAELLKEWYQEVWERRNFDAIERLFNPDTMAEGLVPDMQVGPGDFRDLVMALGHLFGEIEVEIPKIVEGGDWVSALLRFHSTRADNGAPILATGQVMARFDGDRMVEAYNHFDFVSLFEQTGQFPQDTLPVCMTGQRLDWA
ncbi:ester cyclase [Lutimaribacter marinistellae]|uniref:Ester cyclase n=1 Tax=Lutimaribacter marinistellae TaxID=1820329 RepID=A0ABV7TQ12_9RHOB